MGAGSPLTADYVAVTAATAGAHVVEVREDCANGALTGSSTDDPLGDGWTVQLAGS